jgi:predicted DNA-binding transcriptional regulator YafY
LRQGIRFFRVDRILMLDLLEQAFEIPADFDLEAYVATEPYFHRRVQVRLYFAPEAALQALDNRSQWDTVEEQPDGSVISSRFSQADLLYLLDDDGEICDKGTAQTGKSSQPPSPERR